MLVNGKPLLAHWLEALDKVGVDEFIINSHYFAEQVEAFVAQHPLRNKVSLQFEPELLGTGGSLKAYADELRADTFLVAHADNFVIADWPAFFKHHKNRSAGIEISMMTFTTDTPSSCGIVEVDELNMLQNFHEKSSNPPGNQANGAIFLMEPSVLNFIDTIHEPSFEISKSVIPNYLGRCQIWHNTAPLIDIGTPENYKKANALFEEV